jgi:hypothetical protein
MIKISTVFQIFLINFFVKNILAWVKNYQPEKSTPSMFFDFFLIMPWNKEAVGGPLNVNWFAQIFACRFDKLWENLFYKIPRENLKNCFDWTTLKGMLNT